MARQLRTQLDHGHRHLQVQPNACLHQAQKRTSHPLGVAACRWQAEPRRAATFDVSSSARQVLERYAENCFERPTLADREVVATVPYRKP